MPTFSDRLGLTTVKSVIQTESIDIDLRNKIWNFIYTIFLDQLNSSYIHRSAPQIEDLAGKIWTGHLKQRTDEMFPSGYQFINYIKPLFFRWQWFEVYNFLEFILQNYSSSPQVGNTKYMDACNLLLEEQLAAYRFIDGVLTPIATKEEIESIDKSLMLPTKFSPVKSHLSRAISLLSDKTNPDYRNSIKESISAVESMAALITNDDNATLGQALKAIESKHELHPALKSAFSSLYGYTSDADGIRHKLLEEDKLKQEDAIYMLVTCSAFINYLTVKSNS